MILCNPKLKRQHELLKKEEEEQHLKDKRLLLPPLWLSELPVCGIAYSDPPPNSLGAAAGQLVGSLRVLSWRKIGNNQISYVQKKSKKKREAKQKAYQNI